MNDSSDSPLEVPPTKKMKFCNDMSKFDSYMYTLKNSGKPLKVVHDDDTWKPSPLIEVYVGHIKDRKDISTTILLLNQKLPLKKYQHLKRVKGQDIVLCPIYFLEDVTIEKYLQQCDEKLVDMFDSINIVEVPKLPPKLKVQYEDSKKHWPCNFHPDKYLEKLFSDDVFTEDENRLHKLYMELVLAVAIWYSKKNVCNKNSDNEIHEDSNVAIVVDPSINSVVAISKDNRKNHPIQHAAMLVIDSVARTQKGGAWNIDNKLDDTTKIDSELLDFLLLEYPNVKFGQRKFVSKDDTVNNYEDCEAKNGPYLCTGYYVYLLKEPCVMCSMALVHARAKRIFFCVNNEEDGALKSKAKLQTVASLNHHFEVFTGFL